MTSPVQTIKDRLSIVDVISSYLTVEQAGKNYKARCPFHNEKTPSFFISPDRGTYYCFGCGEKGDIFSFVEKFEGTDFLGSLKILALRAGVALGEYHNDKSNSETERYYEIMEEASRFYEVSFINHPEARSYLLGRGVSDISMGKFRIGYAPDMWRSVSDHLIKKGFNSKDIETVGLIKIKGDGFYDRFRSRIIFPITDSTGRVIAFSGRIFGKESTEEAKYINSPDTPLFNKSNVLFGIDMAKSSIRSRGYSIIVEGQMDLILSHQADFANTVAVSGTAFTDSVTDNVSDMNKINNLGLIRRLSQNVIFAFDGDTAGIRAANRAAVIALSLDMQVKIAVLPEGKDPADIILENKDSWKEIIKNSKNIISFHIDRICRSSTDARVRGRQVREVIFPFLLMVKSSIERSAYITEIYSKTGIKETAIIEDFQSYEKANSIKETKVKEEEAKSGSRRDTIEKKLFGIIFWKRGDEELEQTLSMFQESIGSEIFENMKKQYEPFAEALAFEAEMWYGDKTDALTRDIREFTLNLEEEILNERLVQLLDEINKKEGSGEKNELDPVLLEYQKIVGRIANIKSLRSQ